MAKAEKRERSMALYETLWRLYDPEDGNLTSRGTTSIRRLFAKTASRSIRQCSSSVTGGPGPLYSARAFPYCTGKPVKCQEKRKMRNEKNKNFLLTNRSGPFIIHHNKALSPGRNMS